MADLAVLYDRIRPDEKMLFEALDALGVPYDKVYTPHLKVTFDEAGRANVPWRVAIERCVSQTRGHAVTRALEAFGVQVVNPSHVIELCGHGVRSHQLQDQDGGDRKSMPHGTALG